MAACEQRCGEPATVYAIDPAPGGWGGRYCEPCARALRFRVTDRLVPTIALPIVYEPPTESMYGEDR